MATEAKIRLADVPTGVLGRIVTNLPDHQDQLSLLLVCKGWSRSVAESMYRAPPLQSSDSFERLMGLLNTPLPAHPYPTMIRELDISGLAADNLYVGDLDAALQMCPYLEIFRLENCFHISNVVVRSIADHCANIRQVDLPGCPVTDTFIPQLTQKCKKLESMDFSFTNLTVGSLYPIINNCENLLYLDLTECRPVDPESKMDLTSKGFQRPIRLLNLRNTHTSDDLLKYVALHCQSLEQVVLDSCVGVSDDSIAKIANKNSKLRKLDVSFCDRVTDVTLQALAIRAAADNGGSLEHLILTACELVTPGAVQQLAQKAAKLSLLVLDGCDRVLSSFIHSYANYNQELECTLEGDTIRKMAAHSGPTSPVTPPTTPERKAGEAEGALKVEVAYVPRSLARSRYSISGPSASEPTLGKRSSFVLRRKTSRATFDDLSDDAIQSDLARQERAEKLREKRRSRSERITPDIAATAAAYGVPASNVDIQAAASAVAANNAAAAAAVAAVVAPVEEASSNVLVSGRRRRMSRDTSSPLPDVTSPTSTTTTWGEPLPGTAGSWGAAPPVLPPPSVIQTQGRPLPADPWAQAPKPGNWVGPTPPTSPNYVAQPTVIASGKRSSVVPSAPASGDSIPLASGRASKAGGEIPPTSTSPTPLEEKGDQMLIASGRRRGRTPSTGPGAATPEPNPAATAAAPSANGADWNAGQNPATQSGQWGTNPPMWTNPAQLTSASSKWAGAGPNAAQFVDPWARPPSGAGTNDPWAASPVQSPQTSTPAAAPAQQQQQPQWTPAAGAPPNIRMAAGAGWAPAGGPQSAAQSAGWSANGPSGATQQPAGGIVGGSSFGASGERPGVYFDRRGAQNTARPFVPAGPPTVVGAARRWNEGPEPATSGGFVFSNTKRGRMLLKLKIETKNGGHQTLAVHELDDPQQLATEFCAFWDMADFREPLNRLISVRKTNALRQRGGPAPVTTNGGPPTATASS
ncbi:hypothetical protein BJ742DRAFT_767129 [Cladochytrium replicatum]|nr:hypothetical protein BJ742DRAFT_767129 [Cladochytrium replicatum]